MSNDIVERLGHVTADDEQCRCLKCEAAAEIQRLRRWRAEAAEVIGRWETLVPLCDDTMSPHWLGVSKSVLVAAHIATLTADLAAERAEIERLQAEASFWEREYQREQDAWRAERALADLLAEQLAWHDMADPALTTYQEARREQ